MTSQRPSFTPLLDLLEQIRIFLLHPFISSRRGHGELEIRILAHQIQNALKRIAARPRPSPSTATTTPYQYASFRWARTVNCFQPRFQRLQFVLRLPERRVEARLVVLVEQRKIDGFDRRVELLLAFRPGPPHTPQSSDAPSVSPSDHRRIRPVGGRFNAQLGVMKQRFNVGSIDAHGDQKFSARAARLIVSGIGCCMSSSPRDTSAPFGILKS